MMNEDDKRLIGELHESFCHQLEWYNALGGAVQRILSRLVLSRGDFNAVKSEFAEKQRLLVCIENERARTSGAVREWQQRKASVTADAGAMDLDEVLKETEVAIKKFLDAEDQLKRYLESMMAAPARGSASSETKTS